MVHVAGLHIITEAGISRSCGAGTNRDVDVGNASLPDSESVSPGAHPGAIKATDNNNNTLTLASVRLLAEPIGARALREQAGLSGGDSGADARIADALAQKAFERCARNRGAADARFAAHELDAANTQVRHAIPLALTGHPQIEAVLRILALI